MPPTDEPKLLTDEKLRELAHLADQGHVEVRNTRHELLETRVENVGLLASDLARLVDEVRRLRSDEWLTKAAREIVGEFPDIGPSYGGKESDYQDAENDIAAILRKHRDGKA